MVREGVQINKRGDYDNKTVGDLQDLTLIPFERKPDIASHIVDICRKVRDRVDTMEFQIIVPMKERGELCTKKLNLALQPIFNSNDEEGLKRNGYEFKVGDKIIKRGNDYANGIFNGTLGVVREIDMDKKMAGFEFVGVDELVYYSQEDMKDIDMAYALTVHSVQGSQFENVIFAFDYSAYKLLSRQMCYTGLTRASKKCMFLFENEALRYAIDNNETVDRNTFLYELLVKNR
jgi:ATP-dependent exoDNAse (exonuclease V) alpha subunit